MGSGLQGQDESGTFSRPGWADQTFWNAQFNKQEVDLAPLNHKCSFKAE
jgi:hypothetical protein